MKKILPLIVLAIFLYSCKSGSSGSPKSTVNSFIAAAREGNLEEVKKYLTRSDVSMLEMGENLLATFDPNGAKEMKDKMIKGFQDKTKDARVEVKDEKIEGDNATVDVEFTHDGKSETHPFTLKKEDRSWKISLISTGMKNSGANDRDIEKTMKNMNVDSIRSAISKGMAETSQADRDSIQQAIREGMKELRKLHQDSSGN